MPYGEDFYKCRDQNTRYAARRVLSIVSSRLGRFRRAVDFGCGVGTWLSVLNADFGVDEILGLEGPWVDEESLAISLSSFHTVDLVSVDEVQLPHRFDLAISLEVAEHLPPDRGEWFVKQLTRAADAILFSAAIPGQGGVDHVNERWPSYWQKIFDKHGFVLRDFVRGTIWDDRQIPVWYRQNVVVYVRKGTTQRNEVSQVVQHPLSIVHPEVFEQGGLARRPQPGVRESIRLLRRALVRRARRTLPR